MLTVGWALAGNGLVILACLPPCPGGFPHQDIAHIANLLFGAAAGIGAGLALREQPGSIGWLPGAVALGLVIAAFVLEAQLTTVS